MLFGTVFLADVTSVYMISLYAAFYSCLCKEFSVIKDAPYTELNTIWVLWLKSWFWKLGTVMDGALSF